MRKRCAKRTGCGFFGSMLLRVSGTNVILAPNSTELRAEHSFWSSAHPHMHSLTTRMPSMTLYYADKKGFVEQAPQIPRYRWGFKTSIHCFGVNPDLRILIGGQGMRECILYLCYEAIPRHESFGRLSLWRSGAEFTIISPSCGMLQSSPPMNRRIPQRQDKRRDIKYFCWQKWTFTSSIKVNKTLHFIGQERPVPFLCKPSK